MRFIDTKTHGYFDYLVGILVMAAPWILGFNRGGVETWVPVLQGAGVIVYSLLTDYELGAIRKISMRTHLLLDFMGGLLLAASPWISGFADHVYVPHLVLGIAEIGASLMTRTQPSNEKVHNSNRVHGTSTAR